MSSLRRFAWLSLIVLTVVSAACQKSCDKKPSQEGEQKVQEKVLEKKEERPLIASFPGLSLVGLSESQKENLVKFLNEEICPCACPKTFAQCLASENMCRPGLILAKWTVDQIQRGTPEGILFKYVSEEINAGFLADPINIEFHDAYFKGNPSGSVVIVEFADFECPACKIATLELDKLIKENSDVKVYFMHFPLSNHPHAMKAALASEAAGKLGKFWKMHDMLFAHEGTLTNATIDDIAKKLFSKEGGPKAILQFNADLKDESLVQKINAQKNYGQNQVALKGTPTFLFNGRPYHLSNNLEGFRVRLAMEKARAEKMGCQPGK